MRISNNIINGTMILEEYIPLKFVSNEKSMSIDYASYSKSDKSLLEIAYDTQTKQLYRILLVLCKDFSISDSYFSPGGNCESGSLLFDGSFDYECSIFHCEIFKNAIAIKLSENSINKRIISSNMLWELDNENKLISITLFNLSSEEIMHAITELQYSQNFE